MKSVFMSAQRTPVLWSAIKVDPDRVYKFWLFDIQTNKVSSLRPDRYIVFTCRVLEDYEDCDFALTKRNIVDLHISKASIEWSLGKYPEKHKFASLTENVRKDAYVEFSRVNKKNIIFHKIEIKDHDDSSNVEV